MSQARRSWPRFLQEGKFVLGAAAAGCFVGALAAFFVPPLPWVNQSLSPPLQVLLRLAHGVGLGWWAGLFWGLFAVLLARRKPRPPAVARLSILGVRAGVLLLAIWAAGWALELPVAWYAPAGVIASLLTTPLSLACDRC